MKRYYLAALTAIHMLGAGSLQAEANDLKDIYARESALNTLSTVLVKFDYERQTLLNDEKGITVDLKAYIEKSKAWILNYEALVNQISGMKDLDAIQQTVVTTLRSQANLRSDLRGMSYLLRQRINAGLAALKPYNTLSASDELKTEQLALTKASQDLQTRLTRFLQQLDHNESRIDRVSQGLSADFFFLKYQKVALDQGVDANSGKLLSFRNFINAEIVLNRIQSVLDQKIAAADMSMLRSEGEHLKAIIPDIATTCEAGRVEIVRSNLVADQKTRVLGELSNACDRVSSQYQSMVLIYPSKDYAKGMHNANLNNKKNKRACTTTGPLCDAYKKLQNVSLETVGSLNSEGMLFLEKQWREFRALQGAQ